MAGSILNKKREVPDALLMSFSNVIILGGAYLVLRLYKRFFVTYFFDFLLLILYLTLKISILFPVVLIIVMIDTYVQTKKIDSGEKSQGDKKSGLIILGVLTIIIALLLFVGGETIIELAGGNILLSDSKSGAMIKDFKKDQKKIDKVVKNFEPVKDEYCDGFQTREYGKKGAFVKDDFTKWCYLKKAVEANNPQFCYFKDGLGYDVACIQYLAIKNNKPEWCSDTLTEYYEKFCLNNVKTEYNPTANTSCKSKYIVDEVLGELCDKEFGEFFKTL